MKLILVVLLAFKLSHSLCSGLSMVYFPNGDNLYMNQINHRIGARLPNTGIAGKLIITRPTELCDGTIALDVSHFKDMIVLVLPGGCSFTEKASVIDRVQVKAIIGYGTQFDAMIYNRSRIRYKHPYFSRPMKRRYRKLSSYVAMIRSIDGEILATNAMIAESNNSNVFPEMYIIPNQYNESGSGDNDDYDDDLIAYREFMILPLSVLVFIFSFSSAIMTIRRYQQLQEFAIDPKMEKETLTNEELSLLALKKYHLYNDNDSLGYLSSLSSKNSMADSDYEINNNSSSSYQLVNNDNTSEISTKGNNAVLENAVGFVNSCVICLDEFHDCEILRIMPCHHQFHPTCIDRWLVTMSTCCPICKQSVKPHA